MKPRTNGRRSAFTLLELVVVLTILAIVTALAVRAVDGVEEQRRFEASRNLVDDLSAAVLGSPDDRAPDGTRTVLGFIADTGRLPHAVEPAGGEPLTLRELWQNPGFEYRIYRANHTAIPLNNRDEDVFVAGGWRGPYVRLPLGATKLFDVWGKPFESPQTASDAARFFDKDGQQILTPGQEIGIVYDLGANGSSSGNSTPYDADQQLFLHEQSRAVLIGRIEVVDEDNAPIPVVVGENKFITVCVFSPDSGSGAGIAVFRQKFALATNPLPYTLPSTIGPRVVRAYFDLADDTPVAGAAFKSLVKLVTLRTGTNLLDIRIELNEP